MSETIEDRLKKVKHGQASTFELKEIIYALQSQVERLENTIQVYRNKIGLQNKDENSVYIALKDLYDFKDVSDSTKQTEYAQQLEQRLIGIGPISSGVIQKIADYICEKKPFHCLEAGVFLTKLIEACDEQEIILQLKNGSQIRDFGSYLNVDKQILIKGDIGDFSFYGMHKGMVIVKGDVGLHCGKKMNNGEILVKGKAKEYCGAEMKGGKITIYKDVDELCGIENNGGIIEVKGNAKPGCGKDMKNGTIIIMGSIPGWVNSYNSIEFLRGGIIKIYGDHEPVIGTCYGGEIYYQDIRIYPK